MSKEKTGQLKMPNEISSMKEARQKKWLWKNVQ